MIKRASVIFVLFLLASASPAFVRPLVAAAPVKPTVAVASPSAAPTPTPIEYVLPYPGILPTHPLYFIKELRDRLIERLITDPVSRAEFYILQADKKLAMALSLRAPSQSTAMREALADAEASRVQAVGVIESYAKSGKAVPGHVLEKITRSIVKHEEVLVSLNVNGERIHGLLERVSGMAKNE